MGIGREGDKCCPGQAEIDMRNRRDLDRRVRDLADCAMLDVGLRQLVGVKVERLRHQRDREKTKASPDCPALG